MGHGDTCSVYRGYFTAGKVLNVGSLVRRYIEDNSATGLQGSIHARHDQRAVQYHQVIGVLNLVMIGDFFVVYTDECL